MRIALLMALGCFLAACSPRETQVVSVEGMQMQLPKTWKVESGQSVPLLLVRPVDAYGQVIAGAYFYVARDRPQSNGEILPLSGFARHKEQQARQFSLRYALVQNRSSYLGGEPAMRLLRDYSNEREDRRELAYLTIRGREGYSFVGSANVFYFARLYDDFERIIASVRWLP